MYRPRKIPEDRAAVADHIPAARRYRLSGSKTQIRVEDCRDQRTLLAWRGKTARFLRARSKLLIALGERGTIAISKTELQRLALMATTFQYGERERNVAAERELLASEKLWQRLRDIDLRIPSFHSRVARLLFRYPGEHLSAADARCLAELKFPNHDAARLQECLDDLARWGVVQRIAVGADVFYDLDLEPHLHLYDTRTRQLTDAPRSGTLIR